VTRFLFCQGYHSSDKSAFDLDSCCSTSPKSLLNLYLDEPNRRIKLLVERRNGLRNSDSLHLGLREILKAKGLYSFRRSFVVSQGLWCSLHS
jgi:hypothetical protein